MTTRRLGVAVAVLGGLLYAVGGSDGQSPLSSGQWWTEPPQLRSVIDRAPSAQVSDGQSPLSSGQL